jgi:hypothetical protein
MKGVQLEDFGKGSQRSHWEYTLFNGEIMSPASSIDSKISKATLNFFDNMGWYKVNMSDSDE